MTDWKKEITQELDSRIDRLTRHQNDQIVSTGNQYEELNQALAKVIGAPLIQELESIKTFVHNM